MSSDVMMILQIVQQFSAGVGDVKPASDTTVMQLGAIGDATQLLQQNADRPSRSDSLVTHVRRLFSLLTELLTYLLTFLNHNLIDVGLVYPIMAKLFETMYIFITYSSISLNYYLMI